MKTRIVLDPNDLTDEHIRTIGRNYIKKYPATCFVKLFHSNQEHANRLIKYNDEKATPEQRWNFLIDVLKGIPKLDGYLAKSIFRLFPAYFSKDGNKVREEEIRDDKKVLIASLKLKVATHFAPKPISEPANIVNTATKMVNKGINTLWSFGSDVLHGAQNFGNTVIQKIGEAANPTNNVGI